MRLSILAIHNGIQTHQVVLYSLYVYLSVYYRYLLMQGLSTFNTGLSTHIQVIDNVI